MSSEARGVLCSFYGPFNERLFELLQVRWSSRYDGVGDGIGGSTAMAEDGTETVGDTW